MLSDGVHLLLTYHILILSSEIYEYEPNLARMVLWWSPFYVVPVSYWTELYPRYAALFEVRIFSDLKYKSIVRSSLSYILGFFFTNCALLLIYTDCRNIRHIYFAENNQKNVLLWHYSLALLVFFCGSHSKLYLIHLSSIQDYSHY